MESAVSLGGLTRELEAIIRGNVLAGPSTSTALIPEVPPPDAPAIGDIYFGSMESFAGGEPHYGMVTRRNRAGDKVILAPITDGQKNRSRPALVVVLPPKTLPPKRMPTGPEFIPSHVLLRIRLAVGIEQIRHGQFKYLKRLASEYRTEAVEKLKLIWPQDFPQ
jgi:hypothetical protein